jgi:hypothetical protein
MPRECRKMKSIAATLETIRDLTSALPGRVEAALAGGHAVILHGVERTTLDVDLCIWSESLESSGSRDFLTALLDGGATVPFIARYRK